MIGRLHAGYRAAHHGLTDLHGFGVGRRVAHAATHIGVKRQVHGAQQHLAGAGLRDLARFQAEIAIGGLAMRAGGKHDAAVDRRGLRHEVQPPGKPPRPCRQGPGGRLGNRVITPSMPAALFCNI
ncbi:hypothetical protein D3C85_1250930 [compost metagenome]